MSGQIVPSTSRSPCSACGRTYPHQCDGKPMFPVTPPDPTRPLPGSVRDLAPGSAGPVPGSVRDVTLVPDSLLGRLLTVLERLESRLSALESK